MAALNDFDCGLFVGIVVGGGSFGGDGKQPQLSIRMHVRHEALFHWLTQRFPRSRLYGPYNHAGRRYYQWMARGEVLVNDVLPLLEQHLDSQTDGHAAARLERMVDDYGEFIRRARRRAKERQSAS